MGEHGIRGYQKRRRVKTTIPEPSDQKVPDLLKRDFTAQAPNQRYVGDITYLPLADGQNLYFSHGDRLLQPPTGGLVGRRPHAHQPR
jgi:transposase InsO family protein